MTKSTPLSLMSLWRELALECASWCGTSAALDIQKVESRVKAEGEQFFTITLPQFCKDFERSLELGSVGPGSFSGFDLRRSGLPRFLEGFLDQIFDTRGTLLDEPSVDSIRSVRQLTLVFGKIERLCSSERQSHAMRTFVEIEEELEAFDLSSLEKFLPRFRKAVTLLWADVFSDVENTMLETSVLARNWLTGGSQSTSGYYGWEREREPLDDVLGLPNVRGLVTQSLGQSQTLGDKESFTLNVTRQSDLLVPRHGPGATVDRLRGNAKFSVRQWPQRLERVFPYGDYALPSWRYNYQLDHVEFLEPGAELAVKLTPVPKSDKTVRIIAVEPTATQYCQQALAIEFIDRLEQGSKLTLPGGGEECDLGRFFIGFRDQEPNRVLAMEGSHNGFLATLDLSEASDRVLNSHVMLLFERFPQLSEGIQATRSTKARLPSGEVLSLRKFASMGSALCFPVEAMVFVTIVMTAISIERKVPLDRAFLHEMRGKVRVYGDDIVVPVEYVRCVMMALEAFGLKVNTSKSFWNGKFRESCGGDFYDGEWVTPTRLRHELPQSHTDAEGVVGLVAFRNLLYWGGYWSTVKLLDERLKVLLKGLWPIVEVTSSALGRHSVLSWRAECADPATQAPLVKAWIPVELAPRSTTDGVGLLMKFLLKRSLTPFPDENHLERQGRPEVVRIKPRRVLPY